MPKLRQFPSSQIDAAGALRELFAPAVGYRDASVAAEVAFADLRAGRVLPSFVFGAVDKGDDSLNQCRVESFGDHGG